MFNRPSSNECNKLLWYFPSSIFYLNWFKSQKDNIYRFPFKTRLDGLHWIGGNILKSHLRYAPIGKIWLKTKHHWFGWLSKRGRKISSWSFKKSVRWEAGEWTGGIGNTSSTPSLLHQLLYLTPFHNIWFGHWCFCLILHWCYRNWAALLVRV